MLGWPLEDLWVCSVTPESHSSDWPGCNSPNVIRIRSEMGPSVICFNQRISIPEGEAEGISLPEFMNFRLFGKTILVVNIKSGLFSGHPLSK